MSEVLGGGSSSFGLCRQLAMRFILNCLLVIEHNDKSAWCAYLAKVLVNIFDKGEGDEESCWNCPYSSLHDF